MTMPTNGVSWLYGYYTVNYPPMKPYYQDDSVTLYHGDCRGLLPSVCDNVDVAIVSDPPYGIALTNHGMVGSNGWSVVAGDEDKSAGLFVCDWALNRPTILFASPWSPWPGEWPNLIVWDKGGAVGGGGDTSTTVKRTWELIQARNVSCQHGRPEGVWRVPVTRDQLSLHPTQKPEPLMSLLISAFVPDDAIVLDPFVGSGTTLVAAKRIGRKAIGIELNEAYCEIAARRLSQGALPLEFSA